MTHRLPDFDNVPDDAVARPEATGTPRVALAVEPEIWPPVEVKTGQDCSLVMTRFTHLSEELLARINPSAVLVPLIGPGFDVIDVLHVLEGTAFAGHICVLCPAPIQLAPLRAELLAAAPPEARVMLFVPGARIMPCAPLRHPR